MKPTVRFELVGFVANYFISRSTELKRTLTNSCCKGSLIL